jgi:Domain of unknown function (DUF4263)
MGRLDRWKEERRLRPPMLVKGGASGDQVRALAKARWEALPQEDQMLVSQLLRGAREIIFELRDAEPILTFVGWAFDPESFEFVLGASWELFGFDDAEDVKFYLSLALIEDVQVFPNSSDDEVSLAEYYRSLIQEGVVRRDASGGDVRIALTRYGGELGKAGDVLEGLSRREALSPGEMRVLQVALEQRSAEHAEAAKVLAGLRAGIKELGELLTREKVVEAELQSCLTRNPLLFGTHYREVKPKHCLGNQYEMDYALVRLAGFVDLVEIERSSDSVYNQRGDPSGRLVHAEQQVLDWLAWIDEHASYARKYLPGVERPAGYIVIGRDSALSGAGREKLTRRNAAFAGRLEILTFDDLARRADALLRTLTSQPVDAT